MTTTPNASRPLRRWIWAIYWLALATATHLPPAKAAAWSFNLPDTLLHVVSYLALAWVMVWASPGWFAAGPTRQRNLLRGLAALALYGGLDEMTQPFVGRHCQLSDWLADVAGVVVGLGLGLLCLPRGASRDAMN